MDENRKVCFFNSVKAWGGGEKWHHEMSVMIKNRGHQVIGMTNKRSELFKRMTESSIEVVSFRISNSSFLNPIKVFMIARALRRNCVDTVIINLSADLKVAGIASRVAGVRRVIYRRGSAIPVNNTLLNRFIFRYLVDDIIANSEETKATLLSNNEKLFDREKINVIYNGINLPAFDMLKNGIMYEREGQEVVIGNAGRLVKQKGQKYLVEAAGILKSRGLDFKLVIAGEGRMHEELMDLVVSAGLENEVLMLGFAEEIKSFMKSIDIFVLSSLWEGFGYVLVEAMACSKPVVAFDISSNPEIIEDNVTGFLVKPFDIDNFTDKIETILRNPELREKMGKAGRKSVEERFSIETTADRLEEMLFI